MNTTIITADRDEIRDAIAMGFTGSIHFLAGRGAHGNITACDVVNGERTGIFTEVTVSSTRSGTFRRFRVADIAAIEIKDI